MKCIYKTKAAGAYHIATGKSCQDAYFIKSNPEGYSAFAVADGVSTCEYAEIGSETAAQTSCTYCCDNLTPHMDDTEILKVMHESFLAADAAIREIARKEGNSLYEYGTTLCLAVIFNNTLYYGQSGDSGMIALLQNGQYITVTTQQRDELGRVYCLNSGEQYWVFDRLDSPISGVMLMTDGIWDVIVPPELQGRFPNVHVPCLEVVMNHFEDSEEELNALESKMNTYWEELPAKYTHDDKTTVVYIDTDYKPKRLDDTYYDVPNWEKIRKEADMLDQ